MSIPGDPIASAYTSSLTSLVQEGRVSKAQITRGAGRILEAKFKLGLFDNPYVDESLVASNHNNPEHRQLARVVAQRSMVLLRNEGNLLPLGKGDSRVSSVAVIGPLADSKRDIRGSWSFVDDVNRAVTVLEGIRAKVGPAVKVEYAQGVDIARVYQSPFVILQGARPSQWAE